MVKQVIFKVYQNLVFVLVYSLDGEMLFSGGRDVYLKVWDIQVVYFQLFSQLVYMYMINKIVFYLSGRYLVIVSCDKNVKIWDVQSFCLLKVLEFY